MHSETKKLIWLLAGSALLVVILVLGATLALKFVPGEPPQERTLLPLPEADVRIEYPGGGDGRVEIIEPAAADTRPITYTEAGFSPAFLTITSNDTIGCLISVINRSGTPLRVGVNPHDPAGDPGANYGLIAPGETGLLDVRYPGLEEITLHSHQQPEHGFLVRYGEGC